MSCQCAFRVFLSQSSHESYLDVSFALMAVLRSDRILAINGGVAGLAVELQRSPKTFSLESRKGLNMVILFLNC